MGSRPPYGVFPLGMRAEASAARASLPLLPFCPAHVARRRRRRATTVEAVAGGNMAPTVTSGSGTAEAGNGDGGRDSHSCAV